MKEDFGRKIRVKKQIDNLRIDMVHPNKLYKVSEAAKILMLSEQSVVSRIKNHTLRPVRHKKFEHYRFFGSELRRYLNYSGEYESDGYEVDDYSLEIF